MCIGTVGLEFIDILLLGMLCCCHWEYFPQEVSVLYMGSANYTQINCQIRNVGSGHFHILEHAKKHLHVCIYRRGN